MEAVNELELLLEIIKVGPLHYVYVCSESGSRRIKIGVSNDVKRRLEELQTGNAHSIELWFLLPFQRREDADQVERYLHDLYAKYRVSGEWFDLPYPAVRHLFMLAQTTQQGVMACAPILRRPTRARVGLGFEHLAAMDQLSKWVEIRFMVWQMLVLAEMTVRLGEPASGQAISAIANRLMAESDMLTELDVRQWMIDHLRLIAALGDKYGRPREARTLRQISALWARIWRRK
jgi:predicted GIY-YIG superfamily endonuclease